MQYRLFRLLEKLKDVYNVPIDYDCRGQNMKADGYCMVHREESLVDRRDARYTFFLEHQT